MPANKMPMQPHEIDEFVAKLRASGQLIDDKAHCPRPAVGGGLIRKTRVGPKKITGKLIEPGFKISFNSVEFTIPLRLDSPNRGGFVKKWMAGQSQKHRKAWFKALVPHLKDTLFLIEAAQRKEPIYVTFTRIGRMLDDDNLATCFKLARDSVALSFGCEDDAKSPLKWSYCQVNRMVFGIIVKLSLDKPEEPK